MGFGILFLGYFITYMMSWNPFGILFRILGYAIMAHGLLKLKSYQPDCFFAAIGAGVLTVISLFRGFASLTEYLYNNLVLNSLWISQSVLSVVEVVDSMIVFLFHAVLLYAIQRIAKETELPKIAVRAVRNFIFICIYFVLTILTKLFVHEAEMLSYMNLISFFLLLVWEFLDLLLLFSCYAKICDEGDQEMERRSSRFGFVNRFREQMDAKEEKAIAQDRAYRKERKLRKKNK